jgi:hypothetical protein
VERLRHTHRDDEQRAEQRPDDRNDLEQADRAADEQWRMVEQENTQNVELLKLSNQILTLTREVRAWVSSFEKPEPPD